MIAEVLFLSALGACAGGAVYVKRYSMKEKAAHADELSRLRERFRSALAHELRSTRASNFSFNAFVVRCGVEHNQAVLVAQELYGRLCERALGDGVISEDERKTMKRLASALQLDEATASAIEWSAMAGRYQAEVQKVLADGQISSDEEATLSSLRKSLGLTSRESLSLTEDASRDAYVAAVRTLVRAGPVSGKIRSDLARVRSALAISDSDAHRFLRNAALDLYRECFTMAVQDGVFSPEENETLNWLESEAGLTPDRVKSYHDEIRCVEKLAEFRSGTLPRVHTSKMLEGGETCHWESACLFRYQTRKSTMSAAGNLLVTSKRIIFSSPEKTVSYSPVRILDIRPYSRTWRGQTEFQVNLKLGLTPCLP